MSAPEVVCVLGMHRSGTSLATGILHHLGLYVGSERSMMRPAADNPKGFWELEPFRQLNDAILAAFGGTWDDPPAFPRRWERRRSVSELRRRAAELVSEEFSGRPRWTWKDPRTSLTLPLWRRVVAPMRYVICVRNPLDVARSLERRNGFTPERGVELWWSYTSSALRNTAGEPRLVVSYESLVDGWGAEAARLGRFAGTGIDPQREHAIEGFVAGELRHHATPVGTTLASGELPARVRALYALLLVASSGDGTASLDASLSALVGHG